MMSGTLFNGDNSDSDAELKINTEYASNYNNWRQKEELNKLKTRYGNLEENSGSSSDNGDSEESSEDEEEEEELKVQFDKDFYKTLACLKNKDPKIYKEGVSFFSNTNRAQSEKLLKKKSGERCEKEKAVFLRDYERKIIVEREGKFSDSEDEERSGTSRMSKSHNLTYVEEQQRLKDSFKSVLVEDDVGEGLDFLQPKKKSESEREREEADYEQWLKGQRGKINEQEQTELKPLRDFWSNPNLDASEKFLRDYILNSKHLEENHDNADLDYEQIVHDSDDNLSEDEKNIEKQEEFEHKYNFRFEEPDQEFIKRYPRTMENSLRKKDTRRAQKRAEVKQRKEDDKLRKIEELKQLKALKRKEIEEKIEKLKEITGNDDIQLKSIDLDGDFDPNEYDRKMRELFNDEYYATPEGDMKPEFPDLDAELELEPTWDNYDPSKDNDFDDLYEDPHCEDETFNMDADDDGTQAQQDDLVESSRKRKGRRRSKFAELISKRKPKFNPTEYHSYQEYFDKYYSLDYEDMIGDLPCRFKYRKVVPNDYGLSVEEILTADDRELNKWCSLKKALQYKPEHVEFNEVRTYKQKAKDDALKRRILRSLYSTPENENEKDSEMGEDVEGEARGLASKKEGYQLNKKKKRRGNKRAAASLIDSNLSSSTSYENATIVNNEQNGAHLEQCHRIETAGESWPEKRKADNNNEEPAIKKKRKRDKSERAAVGNENQQRPSEKKAEAHVRVSDGDGVKGGKRSTKKSKEKKKFSKKEKNSAKLNGREKAGEGVLPMDPRRLKTYGINPKKLKKKLKYGKMKS